ncbi:MAG: DUF1800 domain-containing protein [Saprospiraceae bacterium]
MENINHLYWRAGFGLSMPEWKEKRNWSTQQAVQQLFDVAQQKGPITPQAEALTTFDPNMTESSKAERLKQEKRLVVLQSSDWIKRMASTEESPFLERMCLFWHGHFACQTKIAALATNQLNTIRQHALGHFRDLLLAITKDASMIRFLNNQQNKKQKPNENFARELMELFTIGRGHYSETDIKEAARAFTGWSSDLNGAFVFRPALHDYGSKTFFGKNGRFDGTDIIDLILEKRETAVFLTQKIYRYFVNEKLDHRIVEDLAKQFYDSDYHIGQLMRTIFTSDWFYLPANKGVKIKSPVALIAGMIRSLNIQFENELALVFIQKSLGQSLFNPPNVAGWPGHKNWIDNSTLLLRLNLPAFLFNSQEVNFRLKEEFEATQRNKATQRLAATVDLQPIYEHLKGKPLEQQLALLSTFFLLQASPPSIDLFRQMTRGKTEEEALKLLVMGILSLPSYQMC